MVTVILQGVSELTALPSNSSRPSGRGGRRRFSLGYVLVGALVALGLFALFAGYYVDWLWFGEVNLRVVFWRSLSTKLAIGLSFGAIFFAAAYGNISIALRSAPRFHTLESLGLVVPSRDRVRTLVRRVGLGISSIGAVVVALATAEGWLTFLRARYAVPFNVTDPVFHRDIGFYVFTLPAWQYVHSFFYATLIAALSPSPSSTGFWAV